MFSLRVRCGRAWCVLPMLLVIAIVDGLLFTTAMAQTCGAEYRIKEGDTLAQIAARVYGSPAQWTVIFYANQDRLGTNASLLVPGLAIVLPCIGGASAKSASPTVPAQMRPPAVARTRRCETMLFSPAPRSASNAGRASGE